MKFEFLQLKNYRNFSEIDLRFSPSVNIFIGKNGQGKTNLLESIYFMTHGESFRPGTTETFIRQQSSVAESQDLPSTTEVSILRGRVNQRNLDHNIELRLDKNGKKFLVDQKRLSSSQLVKNFPTVLFSPDSLAAIKQGPDQRRQLIDDFLISHHNKNRQLISEYRKILRNRNRLLKDHLKQLIDRTEFDKVFASLNQSFFRRGAELTCIRIQALKELLPKMQESMQFIAEDQELEVGLNYLISDEPAYEWSGQQIYDSLQKRAQQLYSAELSSGISLVGPHKHDIQILFNGKDSRYYCSQGQQRTLILSFKMAQIVYHYEVYHSYPVLLLDDVMSELDEQKRKRLVKFLSQINAQILITTTEFDFSEGFTASCSEGFSDENLKVFQIQAGMIHSGDQKQFTPSQEKRSEQVQAGEFA